MKDEKLPSSFCLHPFSQLPTSGTKRQPESSVTCSAVLLANGLQHLGLLRADRHDENAPLGQLLDEGRGNFGGGRGDDDPVEGGFSRQACVPSPITSRTLR